MFVSNIIHFVYFSLGSCIEQGLTTCGFGFFGCYCDRLCLEFLDCCTDIYQLEYCEESKLYCHLKISEFKNNYRVHYHNKSYFPF